MINITEYLVTQIKTKDSEYILGHKGQVADEVSLYRVDGSYIIDKFRIKSIELNDNILTIHMTNEDVVLTVVKSK